MSQFHKTHFVFDVDDTLTDSYAFNQQMFVDTFSPYVDTENRKIDQYLRQLHFNSRGTSMESQFQQAIKYLSLKLKPRILVEQNELLHIQNVDQIKIFNTVKQIIGNIKKSGRQVSICTNRQTDSLTKILINNDLIDTFSFTVSCVDAGHEKPDPYCLLDIIKKSNQSKKDFIYFGDSPTDCQFAQNAGIDFIIIDHYLNQKKFYQMILQSFM